MNLDRIIIVALFAGYVLICLGWYVDHTNLKQQIAECKWALNLVDPIRIEADLRPDEVMPNPHK